MITIREGRVSWTFGAEWRAEKYDAWSFYRRHFQRCVEGTKAMDVVAVAPDRALWMIEAKDYTSVPRDPNKEDLWVEVARKARDTLAGLFAAAMCAANDEQTFARSALEASKVRIVLHIEQPSTPSRLFPRSYDPADLQQKIRQLVRAVDPRAKVVDHLDKNVPWSAAWTP